MECSGGEWSGRSGKVGRKGPPYYVAACPVFLQSRYVLTVRFDCLSLVYFCDTVCSTSLGTITVTVTTITTRKGACACRVQPPPDRPWPGVPVVGDYLKPSGPISYSCCIGLSRV